MVDQDPAAQQLIDNGPFGGGAPNPETPAVEAPTTGEVDGTAPPAGAPAASGPTIFTGIQRSFTDIKDLSAYTLELEKQTLEQQARLSGMSGMIAAPAAASQAAQGLDYKSLGEEFILNPGNAVEKIISHVRSSIMGDVAASASTTEFYRSFYEVNEDLVGCEDLVDASVGKNREAWARIPTEQAAKLLAADVRARASKIRGGSPTNGTILPSKSAHALPSGGNPAPRVAAPPAKVLTFADQLKLSQLGRKKRA